MAEIEKSSLDNSFEKRNKETTTEDIEDKNSSLSKEKKNTEKMEPIVSKDDIMVEKAGIGEKVKKSFISKSMKDVLSFGLYELLIPGIKDAFFALLEQMFYGGDSYYRGRRRREDSRPRTNYSKYYRSSLRDYDDDDEEYRRRKRRSRRDYDDDDDDFDDDEKINYRRIIIKGPDPLENKDKAQEVVKRLRKCIRNYGSTSKAHLFDAVSLPSSYKDYDWGWTEEEDIDCKRIRNGWYLIVVPETEYLGD